MSAVFYFAKLNLLYSSITCIPSLWMLIIASLIVVNSLSNYRIYHMLTNIINTYLNLFALAFCAWCILMPVSVIARFCQFVDGYFDVELLCHPLIWRHDGLRPFILTISHSSWQHGPRFGAKTTTRKSFSALMKCNILTSWLVYFTAKFFRGSLSAYFFNHL